MSFSKFSPAQDEIARLNEQQSLIAARQNADPQYAAKKNAEYQQERDAYRQLEDKRDLEKRKVNDDLDLTNYTKKNDYDLDNQKKAWESANQFRMKEADQSNVAQKDRLDAQLGNQRTMQTATIDQANKLRSDDNERAIAGYKGNF